MLGEGCRPIEKNRIHIYMRERVKNAVNERIVTRTCAVGAGVEVKGLPGSCLCSWIENAARPWSGTLRVDCSM